MRRLVFVLSAMLAVAAPTAAAQKKLDIETFVDQQHQIRDDIKAGRKYRDMDNDTKEKLFRAQEEMFSLLQGRGSIDDLDADEVIDLYNAQNMVNALLTDSELERDICRRTTTVGTHRVGLACYSAREWRRIKETDDAMMRAPRVCMPGLAEAGADPCDQSG
ncbi:MAG TPA: hypothetical protein VFL14_03840 [Xanthomonadales bacterium]|nr:hypothetical protein [Xanthomonadales bacterium]